ncbi:MAG: ribonuclease Z [Candidatus Thorarchaeota archaeon]|nr:MAG: ribonuclease Z [Candidatus Thorarchaeota archaeon]
MSREVRAILDMFEIVFLGTGGSIPTEGRNHPAIAIRFQGVVLLFDAGEDVQRQYMRAGLGLNRPMAIFVSHIHADHVIGLPGLLLRMSLLGRQRPLEIFGPKELIEYVRMTRDSIGLGTTFETTVYAVDEGRLWGHNGLSVRAFPVKHRGLALGFEVTYQRPRGKFHPERAEALGVPRGPLWHNLAMGKAVEIDGRRIEPHEVSDPPPSPLKIVYTGDTRPCESLLEAATGAEVLISEAMYASDKVDLAQERGHMTAREAAELAAEADVKLLVLTHYSPRYDLERGATILNEARELFSNTILAHDLMRIEVTWQGAHVVASRQYS